MECQNTLLDDLSAVIGFTATNVLSAMYGGKSLYIPREAEPGHPIANLIGASAFRVLVASDFGGTHIRFVPRNVTYLRYSKWRQMKDMLLDGTSVDEVAEKMGMCRQHVIAMRRRMEQAGILPMVFTGKDAD